MHGLPRNNTPRRARLAPTRRPHVTDMRLAAIACVSVMVAVHSHAEAATTPSRPNVVLIMTDDQGSGDFGAAGNRVIETPNIDAMAGRSATMSTFYVSPVCSPTRACLMTGRYNYRTRCIDTWLGRSMMEPSETTVAEVLSQAGYATGIFGKWHLGDCYPMRPIDQGFEEALVLRGGGLAQPSEPRENNRRYTNPVLVHNGRLVHTQGYCTDVYFDAARQFIEKSQRDRRNFFVYIPTNAPHDPLHDVPEDLRQHYMARQEQLATLMVDQPQQDRVAEETDRLARICAMITNIDQNVGRLFEHLDRLGLRENTLVIFLVDNGPNTRRYVGDRRGMKSEVYDGGIRSPLWLHWPARLKAGTARSEPAAHIDLMPTILEACGAELPPGVTLDGRSVLPLLEGREVNWPDRTLVLQSHRGDIPVRYNNFMIRDSRWKLLNASGFGREQLPGDPNFELYDIASDPGETRNVAADHPDVTQRLKAAYDQWFDDVSSTRPDNYAPPRIWVGAPQEPETVLTRQDWRGGTWAPESIGYWELHIAASGMYDIRFEFDSKPTAGSLSVTMAGQSKTLEVAPQANRCSLAGWQLTAGDTQLHAVLSHDGKQHGVYQVFVQKQ